jgi:hypothetical protein
MWFLLLWAVGLATGLVQIMRSQQAPTVQSVSHIILLHQFVVTFGLIGLIGIICNILFAKQQAKKLGWPGGPFQIKYGFSQVSLGVLGVMTIWFSGYFWVGALANMYVYGLSGLWSHAQTMVENHKVDAYSAGSILMDVAYTTFVTVLSILARIW